MEDLRSSGRQGPVRPAPGRGADATNGRVNDAEISAGDVHRLWRGLRKDLAEMGRDARTFTELRLQRASLAAREGALSLAFFGWLLLFSVVITIVAAILLMLGMAQGVSALANGGAWVGQLVVGTLTVSVVACAYFLLHRRIQRRFAKQIQRRFGSGSPRPVGQDARPSPSPEKPHVQ